MTALGTLFEEDDSGGGGGGQTAESCGWDSADQEQATEEATLQVLPHAPCFHPVEEL